MAGLEQKTLHWLASALGANASNKRVSEWVWSVGGRVCVLDVFIAFAG